MYQARKTLDDWKKELAPSIKVIKEGIASDNFFAAAEAWFELSDDEKQAIWVAPSKGGPFTTDEREIMKTQEFRTIYYGDEAA